MIKRIATLAAVCAMSGILGGCSSRAKTNEDRVMRGVDPGRDTAAAVKLNADGMKLIEQGDLPAAEKKLQEALAADLFLGPVHNNLGTVYYRQKRYYLAAWEFEYAAKLMPKKAEPRNNLGLVYEAVGRSDQAADAYEQALKIDPQSIETVANLARLYVRQSRHDQRTRELLKDVAMRDTRPEWASWARDRLALMGPGDRPSSSESRPATVE